MQQSDETGELFTAISAAQAEINNPAKNTTNTFFRNEYADLASVLNSIRAVASRHGLGIIQSIDMVDSRVTVQTQLAHVSGQWIRCSAMVPLPENANNIPQAIGVIATYLRRYQAQSMMGIWAGEADDDAQALTFSRGEVTENEVAHIDALLTSTKSNRQAFYKVFNVEKIQDLSPDQYKVAVKQLQQKKRRDG